MSSAEQTNDRHVVVVGAGLSGLATALTAAQHGCTVTLLEAGQKVGGAAAYSGGMVWVAGNHVEEREGIEDSPELGATYLRDVSSHAHPELLDEEAMTSWLQNGPKAARWFEEIGAIRWEIIPGLADYHQGEGAVAEGRYLTNARLDSAELGDWQGKMLVSPYFPVGVTYAEMFAAGRRNIEIEKKASADAPKFAGMPAFGAGDAEGPEVPWPDQLTFGTGVVGSFLARVAKEPGITIRTRTRATELLEDDGRVVGVVADGPDGREEFHGPVVLTTSSFDWNEDLVRELFGLEPEEFGSSAPPTLRGDGLLLARSVGGEVVVFPPAHAVMVPGWMGGDVKRISFGPEPCLPHSFMVNRDGQRFCDDSYWVDITAAVHDGSGKHRPFFLVWDEQHHRKYGLGETAPGEPYPDGLVTQAATLAELAEKLGIDPQGLTATAERFNKGAAVGEDPDFGRGSNEYIVHLSGDRSQKPNGLLGEVSEAPFYGMRLRSTSMGIGSTGVRVNGRNRVVRPDGSEVPGLFAAGSVTALTAAGTAYNSGFALGRGITGGYLIGRQVAGVED